MSLPALLYDLRSRRTVELDRAAARQALAYIVSSCSTRRPTLELVAICWWSLQPDHDAPHDQPLLGQRDGAPPQSRRIAVETERDAVGKRRKAPLVDKPPIGSTGAAYPAPSELLMGGRGSMSESCPAGSPARF